MDSSSQDHAPSAGSALEGKSSHDLTFVLRALYEREINAGISSFWDGGWEVWIGDDMNGFRANATLMPEDLERAAKWFMEGSSLLFPNAHLPWAPTPVLQFFSTDDITPTGTRATLTLVAPVQNGAPDAPGMTKGEP